MPKEFISVSFSGGKDSTAMLLGMIERNEHIDEVVNVDTGQEFPEMYEHIKKVRAIVEKNNIPFITLKSEHSFEWWMLEKPFNSKKWGVHYGFGWPTPVIRWCTRVLKLDLIKAHYAPLKKQYNIVYCVGLASDEYKRLERPQNKKNRHPLVEWGFSERDCLEYCYNNGFDWGGLYEKFNRVSCWCCPLASINELRTLYNEYPELWNKLTTWDRILNERRPNQAIPQFRRECTLTDLSKRFERENLTKKYQTDLIKWGCEID